VVGLELLTNASLLCWCTKLVVIVIIAICMITMMMWMMRSHRQGDRSALDILHERYARGEIDPAKYEERRRMLLS